MSKKYGQCAKCPFSNPDKVCRNPMTGRHPEYCCTELYDDILRISDKDYEPYMKFAAEASRQEISCYVPSFYNPNKNMAIKPRIVETIELCHRMGYRRIGLAFCGGLQKEAGSHRSQSIGCAVYV